MRAFLKILIIFAALCYPFIIYFGVNHFSTRYLLLAIACAFLLRFFTLKGRASTVSQSVSVLLVIAGLVVCIMGIVLNSILMAKFYPVLINGILFIFFFHSLFYPPTVIERIARITHPDLSVDAVRYTRKVTQVWCGFFIANGMISLWTVFFASAKTWMLYNGFIAYFLIGLLFSVEYCVRYYVKKKTEPSR